MTKKTLKIAKREAKRFLERVLTLEDRIYGETLVLSGWAESGASRGLVWI